MWQNGVVMRDWPNGAELLDLARETSGVEVDQPYLRQAQDIAAREEAAGMAPLIAERDRLIEFYGETANLAEPIAQALMRLNARFARDLRAGLFDCFGPRRNSALRLLRESAVARLAETNPDYTGKM